MGVRICYKDEFENDIPNSSLKELYGRVLPELYETRTKMNYVAYAMYKHKLRELPYVAAQNFCIKQIAHQNDRLIYALKHAVRMARPDMVWWFDRLLEAGI